MASKDRKGAPIRTRAGVGSADLVVGPRNTAEAIALEPVGKNIVETFVLDPDLDSL